MLTLGIDIGTSGVRTAVLEGDSVVSMARADHIAQPADAIDASLWWQAVCNCARAQAVELKDKGRSAREIGAIAVDGTSGSMVLTDAALAPVGPALMYNSKGFDAEAGRIEQCLDRPHITRGSNSALARAMRLTVLSERPATHLLHQADFIAARLMGVGGHSDYNNALKTGFDPGAAKWPDWIDQAIDPSLLPQVHAPGAPVGQIDPAIAAELDLSKDTVIHAGTTDSIAAFLAASPLEDGSAVTSLGSTLAIKLLTQTRIDDPDIGLYAHRLGDFWLVGGASNTGGAVLRSLFDDGQLAALSMDMDPDTPTQLDYYPLLERGERFPINDPNLAPRLTPRPKSDVLFLQGILESIARIEACCYQEMQARGAAFPNHIFTAGGGGANATWTKIRARALGVIPQVPAQSEASVGAARLCRYAG